MKVSKIAKDLNFGEFLPNLVTLTSSYSPDPFVTELPMAEEEIKFETRMGFCGGTIFPATSSPGKSHSTRKIEMDDDVLCNFNVTSGFRFEIVLAICSAFCVLSRPIDAANQGNWSLPIK